MGKVTHGMSRTPTYNSWRNMMRRCYEPSNKRFNSYGAKGISVHPSWHSFENFVKDMGTRPEGTSLGRFKDRGNYEPGNVAWQTIMEQRRDCKCNAVLEEEQVHVIRSLYQPYARRGCSSTNMARDLGMQVAHINKIINRKSWSHI